MTPRRRHMPALVASLGLLLAAVCTRAFAQPADAAETAIRATLVQWTRDFNARDASRICDLFAKDLRYDYRGFPERDYDALSGLLRKSLDATKQFAYSQIIVSGDLAVVRLIWTLEVTIPGAANAVEIEGARPRCFPPAARRKLEDHSLHRLRSALITPQRWIVPK